LSIREGDICPDCKKGTVSFYGPRTQLTEDVDKPGNTYEETGYQCNNPECKKKFHDVEARRESEVHIKDLNVNKKKVSVIWQVVACFFLPTGLYCFYRIQKLRKGAILYGFVFGGGILIQVVGAIGLQFIYDNGILDDSRIDTLASIIPLVLGIVLLLFILSKMAKWSTEWNKNIV